MTPGLLLDGSDPMMLPERGYTIDCISTHARAISIIKFEIDRAKARGAPPPVEVFTDIFIRYVRCKRSKGKPPGQIGLKLADLASTMKNRNIYWTYPELFDLALSRTTTSEGLKVGLVPPTSAGVFANYIPINLQTHPYQSMDTEPGHPTAGAGGAVSAPGQGSTGDAPPAYQPGWEMEAAMRESARMAT